MGERTWGTARILRRPIHRLRALAGRGPMGQDYERRSAHYLRLKEKYSRAARYPWLPSSPTPPSRSKRDGPGWRRGGRPPVADPAFVEGVIASGPPGGGSEGSRDSWHEGPSPTT